MDEHGISVPGTDRVSRAAYHYDGAIMPGLLEHLQQNLALQRSTEHLGGDRSVVATDVLDRSDADFRFSLSCIARAGGLIYKDGSHAFPGREGSRLGIILSFTTIHDDPTDPLVKKFNAKKAGELRGFKRLDCYPLFKFSWAWIRRPGSGSVSES